MRPSPIHTVWATSAAALLMAFGPVALSAQPSGPSKHDTGRSRSASPQQSGGEAGQRQVAAPRGEVARGTTTPVLPATASVSPRPSQSGNQNSPGQLRSTMVSTSRRIDEAIRQGRLDTAVREAETVGQHSSHLSTRNTAYPVSCKFLVPALHQSYTEGVRLIQIGRASCRERV